MIKQALSLYNGVDAPRPEDLNEVRNTLLSLLDKSKLTCRTDSLAADANYKDHFPGFKILMDLDDAEKDESIKLISEQYDANTVKMNDPSAANSFCINSQYALSSFDSGLLTSILSKPTPDAKKEIASIAGIDSLEGLEGTLRAFNRYDLILILDMVESEFPCDKAGDSEYIEKFMWITRAKKFSKSLERVFERVVSDSEDKTLIDQVAKSLTSTTSSDQIFTRYNSSGERCNCLYHTVTIGLVNYLCDATTTEEEIERILCAPGGFLQAFNQHRNLNLSASEFIGWLKSHGKDGKPNVHFVQFALAPTLRKMVHARNNKMGENPPLITDSHRNNDIAGMENDLAKEYLANMLGIEIIIYNNYCSPREKKATIAINRSHPSNLLCLIQSESPLTSLVENGAVSLDIAHFGESLPKVYGTGNNTHFQALSTDRFKNLDLSDEYAYLREWYSVTYSPDAYFNLISPSQPKGLNHKVPASPSLPAWSQINALLVALHNLKKISNSQNTSSAKAKKTTQQKTDDLLIRDKAGLIIGVRKQLIKRIKDQDNASRTSNNPSTQLASTDSSLVPIGKHEISDSFRKELLAWQEQVNKKKVKDLCKSNQADDKSLKDKPEANTQSKESDQAKVAAKELVIAQLIEIGFSETAAEELFKNGLQVSDETLDTIAQIAPKLLYTRILIDFILAFTIVCLPTVITHLLDRKNHYTRRDTDTAKKVVLRQYDMDKANPAFNTDVPPPHTPQLVH